ncbi:MAG: GTP 3',8-cyclase MoaA [Flavobacteriales bacterium]|nr:GTP 3',8-cyclase MoaA [Flavobacteriales bacterium]MCB9447310.1 GTP 3',8-cyclase MoaA [Flavobacteriales bacterium]
MGQSSDPLLIDSFGRRHNYLRISLTDRCNLRCFYCMPEEGIDLAQRSSLMQAEEVIAMAKKFIALGVDKIRLTGGEPLVRNDAHGIIKALGALPVELAVTTNGILVDRFVDTFKAAGIRSVNVSLDSLVEERQVRISHRNYFRRILDNVKLLQDGSFHLKLNMVVMKGVNDDELTDFVELTRNTSLHVRFIEFMPFRGNKWTWAQGFGYDEIMEVLTARYGADNITRLQANPNETARCFTVNGYMGTFGIIGSVTHPFCSDCNRIRLTADGKLKNCLFSNGETDLLTPMREGRDVTPLILQNIRSKAWQRGGMNSLKDMSDPERITQNRSMVAIGG